jgi:hypothetical protein
MTDALGEIRVEMKNIGEEKNEKSVSLVPNPVAVSTMFWGLPMASGEELSSAENPMANTWGTEVCYQQNCAISITSLQVRQSRSPI